MKKMVEKFGGLKHRKLELEEEEKRMKLSVFSVFG
jgi:hypothetical protein